MLSAIFRGITRLIRRSPRVPRESLKLLDDVQPPTREEIELYVPETSRSLGPDWIFTRGKVLTFSETRKTRTVGSVGGFDVDREFEEEYAVYSGIYGYRDHAGRVHAFRMEPTENDKAVRPGRSFIVCFDRRSPRVHRLFRAVRLSHPMRRHER
jgi:hypothetical protein